MRAVYHGYDAVMSSTCLVTADADCLRLRRCQPCTALWSPCPRVRNFIGFLGVLDWDGVADVVPFYLVAAGCFAGMGKATVKTLPLLIIYFPYIADYSVVTHIHSPVKDPQQIMSYSLPPVFFSFFLALMHSDSLPPSTRLVIAKPFLFLTQQSSIFTPPPLFARFVHGPADVPHLRRQRQAGFPHEAGGALS